MSLLHFDHNLQCVFSCPGRHSKGHQLLPTPPHHHTCLHTQSLTWVDNALCKSPDAAAADDDNDTIITTFTNNK